LTQPEAGNETRSHLMLDGSFQDIFRKYPNKYESVIATLCENLDTLDEPEARASMIWIIGEYAERIDNADELLESFLEGFQDENTMVSLYQPHCHNHTVNPGGTGSRRK